MQVLLQANWLKATWKKAMYTMFSAGLEEFSAWETRVGFELQNKLPIKEFLKSLCFW